MKKQLFITCIFFIVYSISYGQDKIWKLSSEALEYPKGYGVGEVTMAYLNGYDTIPCSYKVSSDESIYKGYKLVYKKNGFYIDDQYTLNVFFDDKKKKIQTVYIYLLR